MKDKVFLLERGWRWDGAVYVGKATICIDGLAQLIDLPDTKRLYAVFTVRPRKDSFTLKPDGIEEWKGDLFWSAQRIIHKMYVAGYKYVHFEY